ncbi:hypothetical protein Peur_073323 [Populus x canadensis]
MANEREVMKIEKIRLAEIILFWIERAAILLFVFFGGIPRFLSCSLGLFAFTNLYHASHAYERLFVNPEANEPSNTLFVFDRYAIWLAAMYFFLGSPVYRYVAAAVFVISNTNSILKALGVNANQILCCNPTKDDKEEEIEKALAMEEYSAEEKTKHGEIEEIPETETIEPEAHHEVDEEDYEMVSNKKDVDEEEEEDCSSGGGDEEEEEDCSSSVGDDDEEEEDCSSGGDDEEGEEDCSSSVGDDDDEEEEEEEEEYCYSSDDDGDVQRGTIEKEVMKDQELKETGDGRCCETSRAFLSSMQREIGLLKELNEKNCKLVEDLADTLLLLEQENEVLSRKLIISAESTSSTEQLNQIVYEYERKCQRLEEEKADLNASLSTAEAESDFYRECMHNLGLSNELPTISTPY